MKNMEYALKENIGSPELFTGRRLLMDNFIHWVSLIGKELGKSRALLSRRKKGKTVLMQRLFNIVWSQNEKVVPFFYEMKEHNMTLGEFAEDFLCTFLSHYYAFKYRDKQYIIYSLKIEELVYFFEDDFIIRLINTFKSYKEEQNESVMWELARKAPHAVASYLDIRVLQFIDEFQNINKFILDKDKEPITTLAGSYLASAESKCAPMLIAGSYTGLLRQIIWEQLPARFNEIFLGNLEMAEGYDMILKYSQFYEMPVNTQTTQYILGLTQGDPYYISTLFESSYMGKKYLTNANSISDVYSYEITKGNINGTWSEYLRKGFSEETDLNDKRIALYLFNATGKERTREQIMTDLKFEMTDNELEKKLKALVYSDIISQGESNVDYKVGYDKIYELVFRNIYQKEIDKTVEDVNKTLKSLIGKFSYDIAYFYKYQFEKMLSKGFKLSDVSYNGDSRLIVAKGDILRNCLVNDTRIRNMQVDFFCRTKDSFEVYVEINNQAGRTSKKDTANLIKLKNQYDGENRKTVFIHFSMNGYYRETEAELAENGVFYTDEAKFSVVAKKV